MVKVCSLEEDMQLGMVATTMSTTGRNQRVEDKAMEDRNLNRILAGSDATTAIRRVISREIERRC